VVLVLSSLDHPAVEEPWIQGVLASVAYISDPANAAANDRVLGAQRRSTSARSIAREWSES